MNYQCPAMIYHKLLFRERYSDQLSRTDNLFNWFLAARRPVVLHHTGNYISPRLQTTDCRLSRILLADVLMNSKRSLYWELTKSTDFSALITLNHSPSNGDELISNKNELIIKSELRVLNLSPLDAFRLVSLIDALPTQWRESLKSCIYTGDTPFNLRDEIKLRLSGQIVLLEKAYSKIVYKELRNRIVTPPTAKLKFNAHFVNDTLNWKKSYSLPYSVALYTKTRDFQNKLLNRCLVTNTFLLYTY